MGPSQVIDLDTGLKTGYTLTCLVETLYIAEPVTRVALGLCELKLLRAWKSVSFFYETTQRAGTQASCARRAPWRMLKVASTYDRVVEIVAEQLGAAKEKISSDTHFVNDLGADSLDVVELVMELEEEFDVNIPDDAAEKIQTIGQAVDFIEQPISQ